MDKFKDAKAAQLAKAIREYRLSILLGEVSSGVKNGTPWNSEDMYATIKDELHKFVDEVLDDAKGKEFIEKHRPKYLEENAS